MQNTAASYAGAEKQDCLWTLGCLHKADGALQMMPAWTGFSSTLSDRKLSTTTIHYMPFIRASLLDLSTIYMILIRLVEMSTEIGQSHILVTADMAIYNKAQQILWEKPLALISESD